MVSDYIIVHGYEICAARCSKDPQPQPVEIWMFYSEGRL